MAAFDAFRTYGQADDRVNSADHYALLGAFYTGSWHADPRWPWATVGLDVYGNSRQLMKATKRIVNFYEQLVWQGDLSTDGKPLPDGTRGAIPIDPQTGGETTDEQLLVAIHQNFAIWNWRRRKGLIAKTAAIFGDVPVELVDLHRQGVTVPNILFPGYVPDADLGLDENGNIKHYAIEYDVVVPESTSFGRTTKADRYRFRKEVDGEKFRFYRDGKPASFPAQGIDKAEYENPYGFVPAVLFRHEEAVGSNRGIGAYEHTLNQAMELNSTLSAATDYQRRQFGAPILIKGTTFGTRERTITMPGGITLSASTTESEIARARRELAETINLRETDASGGYEVLQFDIGQTMDMVRFTHDSLLAENPEAEYAKRLQEMTQVTGPGGDILLSPIQGLVDGVRSNLDPPMLALCQMGVSIMGYRVNNGDIPEDLLAARAARYDVFRPFGLDSWDRGLLDASIPQRPIFPESREKKLARLALMEALEDPWTMAEAGWPKEEIARRQETRQATADEFALAFNRGGTPVA